MTDTLSREQYTREQLNMINPAVVLHLNNPALIAVIEKLRATALAVMDEMDSQALTLKLIARNREDEKSGVAAFTDWLSRRYPMEAGRECFDVARERLAGWDALKVYADNEHQTLHSRIAQLEGENAKLKDALQKHGQHSALCQARRRPPDFGCVCGLTALLSSPGRAPETREGWATLNRQEDFDAAMAWCAANPIPQRTIDDALLDLSAIGFNPREPGMAAVLLRKIIGLALYHQSRVREAAGRVTETQDERYVNRSLRNG